MNSWLKYLVVLLFLSSVVACTPAQVDTGVSAGNENPTEVRDAQLLGEPYIELNYQQVLTNNCDGQNRVTRLERSLSQGQTTSLEVQASVGGLLEGALVPQVLGAEIEAKIQALLAREQIVIQQQGVHIELETQPGTVYQHTVTWKERKVNGVIDVVYPDGVGRVGFEKIIGLELGDRTSRALSCSGIASITLESPSPTPLNTVAPPNSTSEPTVLQPTPTFSIYQDISTYPGHLLSETRVPSGTSMEITVNSGEIHAVTAGTIRVAGVSLPGGQDRGSVVILLPPATYHITELTPTWNWHGAFRLEPNGWGALADVLAAQQMIPGTCSGTNGCSFVDVLVVGPDGLISQYEVP